MTLNQAVEATLEANAGVTALVGTRVYTLYPPSGAPRPLITFALKDQPRIPDSSGYIDRAVYDIAGWDEDDADADAVLEAVTTALEGKTLGANYPGVGSITRTTKRMEALELLDGQVLKGHVGTFEINLGGSL